MFCRLAGQRLLDHSLNIVDTAENRYFALRFRAELGFGIAIAQVHRSSWLLPSLLVVIPEDRILEVNPEDNAAVLELPN